MGLCEKYFMQSKQIFLFLSNGLEIAVLFTLMKILISTLSLSQHNAHFPYKIDIKIKKSNVKDIMPILIIHSPKPCLFRRAFQNSFS